VRTFHSRQVAASRRRARCRGRITELLEGCARGDEAALGRLVDLLQPVVLAASGQRFPHLAAEDVAVEVFVRVWQLAPTFDRRRQVAELPERTAEPSLAGDAA
jgi:DNA-directed RNA polymerase specialized sigma24 family protein